MSVLHEPVIADECLMIMNVLHGHVMTGSQCTVRARDDQVNVKVPVMNEHTRFIAAVDKSKQTDLFSCGFQG